MVLRKTVKTAKTAKQQNSKNSKSFEQVTERIKITRLVETPIRRV